MKDSIKTIAVGVFLAGASFAFASTSVQAQELSQEHIDWCTQQHPSYNAATNEYDSGRAIKKKCSSPFDDSDVVDGDASKATIDANLESDDNLTQQHKDWCIARHPSYDVSTNSFETGAGGIKKNCSSPYN